MILSTLVRFNRLAEITYYSGRIFIGPIRTSLVLGFVEISAWRRIFLPGRDRPPINLHRVRVRPR